jgi:hypothetical protein
VKQRHQVDLAYLYYFPFCSVFTPEDRFHAQIAPLFMNKRQTFVHGDELKEDLARLESWRTSRDYKKSRSDPEEDKKLVEEINQWVDDEDSEEQEQRMWEHEQSIMNTDSAIPVSLFPG